MGKRIAILQSAYIPWKGYFDMINMVDEFIIYDKVGFSKNDWRNRNRIKTSNGLQWLTIPVYQPNINQAINEVRISNPTWSKKHWKAIVLNYIKAPYFKTYKEDLEGFYLSENSPYLSEINLRGIRMLCKILNISTPIITEFPYDSSLPPTERLIEICKSRKADAYLTGPAAKSYLSEPAFNRENINLNWMDYSNYPEYPQLTEPFTHNVSVLDLIFNIGPESDKYMQSFPNPSKD